MVKLIVLLPTRVFGGHERMLIEWLRNGVARHGLRVSLYGAGNEALARECEHAGLGRPAVSYPPRASALRDFWVTRRLLGRLPVDLPVLLAPGVLQQSLLHWLAAFLRRRRVAGYLPMAYSSRHMRFRGGALRDWVVGHVIRRVDVWITISNQQRELLIRQWHVTRPVLVVPNRITFDGRRSAHRSGGDGPLRVLFAGRFDANQKGLDWLCERLRARRNDWAGRMRFLFKGEGSYAAELLRLRGDLGAEHVEVCAWGDVTDAMAEADVLLLPSRFEGLPLVALEATHYGLPVVASKSAGLSDVVAPSCIFDFGDERAMWAALETLRDDARRGAAVAHARCRVEQSLSAAVFRESVDRVMAAFTQMA